MSEEIKKEVVQQKTKKEETIFDLIEKSKNQIALALPNSMSADRLCRVFVTELRKNPKLLECNKMSLMSSMMQIAQLGLEVGVIGHCYLVPYKTECQLIVGYKGLVSLALRSGEVKSLVANCVFENDFFDYTMGTESYIKHKPTMKEKGNLIAVYAVAKLKDGSTTFDIMSREDIEAIKKRSKTSAFGPWVTDYNEMAKKTVVRRFCKMLPVSVEAQEVAAKDELEEFGIKKDYKEAVEAESKKINDLVFGEINE